VKKNKRFDPRNCKECLRHYCAVTRIPISEGREHMKSHIDSMALESLRQHHLEHTAIEQAQNKRWNEMTGSNSMRAKVERT
jgi:hypothetical protein